MATGKVNFYDDVKGYGFIRPDGNGPDIFVHATGLVGVSMLQVSQRVEFESVYQADRGKYKAVDVRVIP
ncbi:cold-shock protein [Bradyrhizobium sp. USDA 10063]